MTFYISRSIASSELTYRIWLLQNKVEHRFIGEDWRFYLYRLDIPNGEDALAFTLRFPEVPKHGK